MKEAKTHYCLGGESHQDECDCPCIPCDNRRKTLQQEAFNRRLSARIQETFADSEFRKILAEEILKK